MADWKKRSASPEVEVTGMLVFEWTDQENDFKDCVEDESLDDFPFCNKRNSQHPLTEEERRSLRHLVLRYEHTEHGGLTGGIAMMDVPTRMTAKQIEKYIEVLPEETRKEMLNKHRVLP